MLGSEDEPEAVAGLRGVMVVQWDVRGCRRRERNVRARPFARNYKARALSAQVARTVRRWPLPATCRVLQTYMETATLQHTRPLISIFLCLILITLVNKAFYYTRCFFYQ